MQAMWGALHPPYGLTEIHTHLCSRNRGMVIAFYTFCLQYIQKCLADNNILLDHIESHGIFCKGYVRLANTPLAAQNVHGHYNSLHGCSFVLLNFDFRQIIVNFGC